jgi:hypothetical protein
MWVDRLASVGNATGRTVVEGKADMDISSTGPIAEEAASFARALVEAKIHQDDEFFDLVWGQMCLPDGSTEQAGDVEGALADRVIWQGSLIASLTTIAAAGILVGTKDAADEVDKEAALRFLGRMGRMGMTF